MGCAASRMDPRGDSIGAVDGNVAGSPKNVDGDGAWGSGELYPDPACTAGQVDRTEPELAQVCGEPRDATTDLDVPGDRSVERDLGWTLEPEVALTEARERSVHNAYGARFYPDDRHLTLEAGAVEILHRRIGVDGDVGRARDEQQVPAA